ncbi:MAG: 9-O-acetylesterase [Thalassobius sp.]|nr:9-O-acetylesterase [Thalassovita sp.]
MVYFRQITSIIAIVQIMINKLDKLTIQLITISLSFLIFSCGGPAQTIKLNSLFTDNMVLQREIKVPVWGKATPGRDIKISIADKEYKTTAKNDSTWLIHLEPHLAGGPYQLTIQGEETIVLKDVMFGDVWICAGEGNMDLPVMQSANAKNELAKANQLEIRLFKADQISARSPQDKIEASKGWRQCTSEEVANFSAVAYQFGKQLKNNLNVPVGLIQLSWKDTPVEAWLSEDALIEFPEFSRELSKMKNNQLSDKQLKIEYEHNVESWKEQLLRSDPGYPSWLSANFNLNDWSRTYMPSTWDNMGRADFNGVIWFRKTFELPEDWKREKLNLGLGRISDMSHVFWNGELLAFDEEDGENRNFEIPASKVRSENEIMLRITDLRGQGGIIGNYENFKISNQSGDRELLAGIWRFRVSQQASEVPKKPENPLRAGRPTVLYNSMVNPLAPFAFRGVIWYQGESDIYKAQQYEKLFPALITDWRAQWINAESNLGEFPFLFVQLPNYGRKDVVPQNSIRPQLREAQLQTLSIPNTGMAVTIDLGEGDNLYPTDKLQVSNRLALNAYKLAYNIDSVFSGPIYKSMAIEGGQIRLTFDYIGDGLMIKGDEKLDGFAIAGSNKTFVWADAKIEGETIVVKSRFVPKPVAVRYGWGNNPTCNLYNRNGLPASPFRTDTFDKNASEQ